MIYFPSFHQPVNPFWQVALRQSLHLRLCQLYIACVLFSISYYTCVALHNFIRIENKAVDERIEIQVDNENLRDNFDDDANEEWLEAGDEDNATAKLWRDSLANDMWDDYVLQH